MLGWGVVPYALKNVWSKIRPDAILGVVEKNLYEPIIGILGDTPDEN